MEQETPKKQVTIVQASFILLLLVGMILVFIKAGSSIIIPLLFSWFLLYFFVRIFGMSYDAVFSAGMDALRKASGAMCILLSVGVLIGGMIASGTIQTFVYYGLKIINPGIFLLCSCVITMIMTLAVGTNYGSVASVGIALMGIGTAMEIPTGMVAAAVLTGGFLGNQLSPLADTPVLCCGLVDGNLFRHIRYSLWTTIPSFVIACIIFTIMGMQFGANTYDVSSVNQVLQVLADNFKISPIALIPVLVIIVLLILKMPAVPSIIGGAIAAALVAIFYQGQEISVVLTSLYRGYTIDSSSEIVNTLLNRGGIISMAESVFILISAVSFGGMLEEMGVINAFLKPIVPKLDTVPKIIGATILTEYFINAVGSALWLAHILTAKMFIPIYKKKNLASEMLSRTMSDAGIATIVFPWHAMTVYFTGVLGCEWSSYMPYIFMTYIAPVIAMICAFTGIGMYYTNRKEGV